MNRSTRIKFIFVQSLTLGRIPLILIFLAVSLLVDTQKSEAWFYIACGAMILSAVTDLFDGYFARKFKVTTPLGAYADPLADKVFYLTAFPTLIFLAGIREQALHSRLLLGLAILFLLRDQWVSFLRSIGARHNVDAKANWSGKARTVITFPTICFIYYYIQAPPHWWLQLPAALIYTLESISVVINVISIGVYTQYYWPWLKIEMQVADPKDTDDGGG